MNITELDEFQGLTAEMVREWLLANQWEPCGSSAAHLYYQCGSGEISEALLHEDLGWVVDLLAQSYERLAVQALLREINPRWRKGFPSTAALSEHDKWLIRVPWGAEFVAHISYGGSDDGYMILIPPDRESGDCGGIAESVWKDCVYWPCDGNANRARWPVDAEGNML